MTLPLWPQETTGIDWHSIRLRQWMIFVLTGIYDKLTGGRAPDWPWAIAHCSNTLSTAEFTGTSRFDIIMSWRSRVSAAEGKKVEDASDNTRRTSRKLPILTGRLVLMHWTSVRSVCRHTLWEVRQTSEVQHVRQCMSAYCFCKVFDIAAHLGYSASNFKQVIATVFSRRPFDVPPCWRQFATFNFPQQPPSDVLNN